MEGNYRGNQGSQGNYGRDQGRDRKKEVRDQCMYFMQGKCRFGRHCRFSHEGFTEAIMVRHAESEFNRDAHHNKDLLHCEQPLTKVHLNQTYIDSGLSEEGRQQCTKATLPKEYLTGSRNIDIVFVSPMNRTLQTADLLIKVNHLKVKRVVVLPELSEVLSKICDFASGFPQKKKHYKNYDFSEMDRFMKEQFISDQSKWQDPFVDQEHIEDITEKEQYAHRYLHILDKIFPTPLENSERCFDRAMRALSRMKEIVTGERAESVVIVSHNRILKYISGRFNKGRASSFLNCQARELIF